MIARKVSLSLEEPMRRTASSRPPPLSDEELKKRLGGDELEALFQELRSKYPRVGADYQFPGWAREAWQQQKANLAARENARLQRLGEEFFCRLQDAGNLDLSQISRGWITGIMTLHTGSADGCERQNLQETVTEANKLRSLLRDQLITDGPHSTSGPFLCDMITNLGVLIESNQRRIEISQMPPSRVGWRATDNKCALLGLELAKFYRMLGGKVVFHKKDGKTYRGPFPDFLHVIWEGLERSVRPASSQTFVHYTKLAWSEHCRECTNPDCRFG